MQGATGSLLTTWQNFYVIIGSSAAALTGLMFVVITLVAGARQQRSSEGIAAFGTPNVVHFCAVLLVAATLSAPWQVLWNASLLLGFYGLGGQHTSSSLYGGHVVRLNINRCSKTGCGIRHCRSSPTQHSSSPR